MLTDLIVDEVVPSAKYMIALFRDSSAINGSQDPLFMLFSTVRSPFEVCFGEIDTTLRGHDSRFDTSCHYSRGL